MAENASAAIRESVTVEEAARSAGVFKQFSIFVGENFRLAGTHSGVILHEIVERFEPPLGHSDIVVEQEGVFIVGLLNGFIVSLCKTEVFLKSNDFYIGKIVVNIIN